MYLSTGVSWVMMIRDTLQQSSTVQTQASILNDTIYNISHSDISLSPPTGDSAASLKTGLFPSSPKSLQNCVETVSLTVNVSCHTNPNSVRMSPNKPRLGYTRRCDCMVESVDPVGE